MAILHYPATIIESARHQKHNNIHFRKTSTLVNPQAPVVLCIN